MIKYRVGDTVCVYGRRHLIIEISTRGEFVLLDPIWDRREKVPHDYFDTHESDGFGDSFDTAGLIGN